MTPQELKDLAVKSSKQEADQIEAKLKEAATKGHFSNNFKGLSAGVIQHLKAK